MENRRPITEDDIYLTELLIAKSYGQLKHSVTRVSSQTLGSVGEAVGDTVRKHPYATAGAAVGAGIIIYGLFRIMNRKGSSGRKEHDNRKERSPTGMTTDILGMLMPIFAPYLTAYIQRYLGQMFAKDRD
ncbi:MAG: hypothetical protein M0Q92_00850 [Methanoregula sp.]|nr:hypothetical protein [Methanoregula sp.]